MDSIGCRIEQEYCTLNVLSVPEEIYMREDHPFLKNIKGKSIPTECEYVSGFASSNVQKKETDYYESYDEQCMDINVGEISNCLQSRMARYDQMNFQCTVERESSSEKLDELLASRRRNRLQPREQQAVEINVWRRIIFFY